MTAPEPPLAASTQRHYARDFAHFSQFCTEAGQGPALPSDPETVAAYLAASAKVYATATLQRRLQAIVRANRQKGVDALSSNAVVRQAMQAILRQHRPPARRAAALGTDDIKAMVAHCPSDLTGIRDAAMVLLAYAGALRRSELVGVDYEHCTFEPRLLRLRVRGVGLVIPMGGQRQTCPVRSLQHWLEVSGTRTGPVFRGVNRWGHIADTRLDADGVRRIVQRAAARAGIEVAAGEALSPHGLRAGFATEAHRRGAWPKDIMDHTRHKSIRVLRGYMRRSSRLPDNPARLLGL